MSATVMLTLSERLLFHRYHVSRDEQKLRDRIALKVAYAGSAMISRRHPYAQPLTIVLDDDEVDLLTKALMSGAPMEPTTVIGTDGIAAVDIDRRVKADDDISGPDPEVGRKKARKVPPSAAWHVQHFHNEFVDNEFAATVMGWACCNGASDAERLHTITTLKAISLAAETLAQDVAATLGRDEPFGVAS